jgi:hypothetical protein
VTLSAAVTGSDGTPSGTVTFSDGSTTLGSAVVVGGTASISLSNLALGSHQISAAYSGDGSNQPSSAGLITEDIASPSGGTVTLSKSTSLIGNDTIKVSGSGWNANGDTSVTINECASAFYLSTSCDAANQVSASVDTATGKKLGTFAKTDMTLAVGSIDGAGDTCGLASSSSCYIVVAGSNGDSTSSAALGFIAPKATAKKSSAVDVNYVDDIKATDFPSGDTVNARECDSSVNPASNLSTDCDSATVITGTAGRSGTVVFSPKGVTVKAGAGYSETGTGTVVAGGTADIVVVDSTRSGIAIVIPISLAS